MADRRLGAGAAAALPRHGRLRPVSVSRTSRASSDEAIKRYGADFVAKNGQLPWRATEIYQKLVEAFRQQAPYSRDNIKFFSSVLTHYVSDGHVPFHAVLNYDGQLTGQWGIHSRFETELFERYRATLRVVPEAGRADRATRAISSSRR